MGSCNCMNAKKEEGSIVIDSSTPTKNAKLQSETAPASVEVTSININSPVESANSNIMKPKSPDLNVVQVQSAIRGYLIRKVYKNSTKFHIKDNTPKSPIVQELNQIPNHLISPLAREIFNTLGPFKFDDNNTLGVLSKGQVKSADGGVYMGEWGSDNQYHGIGTLYSSDGSISEGN